MNEYNNINLNDNENNSQKPKRNTLGKVTAFLMAMVMVSGGSIAVYREITENPVSAVTETAETNSEKKSSLTAEKVSLINTDSNSGTVLTTEEVVQKVLPSVVGIESQFTVTSNNNGYYYGFGMPSTSTATGTGTGVVITEDGYIVTNAHVIYDSEYGAGLSENITVHMNDDSSYDAEVIGYDTDCDLAVLKIDASGLTAAEFGDSDSLMLGESVIAIGNPLGFDLMNTVTSGIVSGLNRNITINDKAMNLIQTDTAINSGNSGGPLINKYGQVIGINSSKMSASYGEASIEGIGFAIPSNETAKIIDDLMSYGYVTGKPQLGISCHDVTENVSRMYNMPVGVYIKDVSENSASEKAGLQSGDIITAVDGVEVSTAEELNAQKNMHSAGDTIKVTYVRNGVEKTAEITLDEIRK
ncbi:MAG: trypsin-like peptidase domain-containing protein [Prevotella sp.]|nr:trypsin-like peptidase domain-containing protein [Alistipes senegalensis]MCM1358034.1 trypsin-like peptidase domain-containing protein [Prevotella sp.]MCM1473680.1 trypsin-like peptidase domain-containing protein [Muribaculaceae bacterium]